MATIRQSVSYIMNHPFMAMALQDPVAMEKLLFEIHFHCYSVVAANGAKEFRKYRDMNDPIIVSAIRDQAPPCNLDIRLPIPEPQCAVIEIRPGVTAPSTGDTEKNTG